MIECPCNGCTAETGRSPTCHGDGTCTRGHDEWKANQIEEQRAIRTKQEREKTYERLKIESTLKTIKRGRHGRK